MQAQQPLACERANYYVHPTAARNGTCLMTPTTSLLDRANLDRDSVRNEVARGLAGADDGESYRDIRPLVRVNVSVVAGQGDRQESGSKGYGGREPYARFIGTKAWREAADGAIREALVNLDSVPAPAGEMDVVLGPGWPGVMLHEAVGHGLEGDFNRKQTSAFAGLMGQQVAAKGVTVVDDGQIASRRGSLAI